MKILMVTSSMDPGGCETHILGLAAALTRMGHTVHLASSGGAIADLGRKRRCFVSHVLPLECNSPAAILASARGLRALIRKHRFSVIHAHTRRTALLLWCMGVAPLVTTAHWTFRTDFPHKQFTRWGEHTLAVSPDIAEYLKKEYRIPQERITVTCNGVDPSHFASEKNSVTRRIVHVSRLDNGRSLACTLLFSLMPTLATIHRDLTLTVVGDGDRGSALKKEAKRINQMLDRDAIRMMGAIADPAPFLKDRPIFVGVSRAAEEAMACGCPVVLCGDEGMLAGFDARGEEEIRLAAKSNFCCRGCPSPTAVGLFGDLKRLLSLPGEELLALGDANRDLIRSRFTEDVMAKDAIAVYRSVRRTVLCGYYGKGNLGDRLSHEALSRQVGGRTLTLCASPRLLLDIPRAVRFMRPGTRFILGGGTLLQNATSNRSLAAYTAAFSLARARGCVTELRSAGIGPLVGTRARKTGNRVLRQADLVELRTRTDLEAAKELCPERTAFYLGHDAALDLARTPASRTATAVIALRDSPLIHEEAKRQLVGLLKEIGRRGFSLLFLKAHPTEDAAIAAEIAALTEGGLCPLGKEREALAAASLVFTMRLHPALLALLHGIPAFAFPTDEKLPALWRDLEDLSAGHNPALTLLSLPFSPRDGFLMTEAAGKGKKEITELSILLQHRRRRIPEQNPTMGE